MGDGKGRTMTQSSPSQSTAYWSACIDASVTHEAPPDGQAAETAAVFGLDGQHTTVLFDDFHFEIEPGEIVAVLGPSGSGKSVLLHALRRQIPGTVRLRSFRGRAAATPAVECIPGGALREKLELLARVGLADATAMVTPAGRLSGGQKHRLALAIALHRARRRGRPTLILADEYASVLDATTAIVLSRQIRRIVSKEDIALVLATPRQELLPAIQPDRVVLKAPLEPPRIVAPDAVPTVGRVPTPSRWRIRRGRLADYHQLAGLHYLTGPPAANKRVYSIATPRDIRRSGGPELAAVLVVSPPVPAVRGRNIATGGRYATRPRRLALRHLNAEMECISRVVVHPMFRGCGLAVRLVRHALHTAETPLVEALAAMGKIHPFFARAGMRRLGIFRGPNQYYHYFIHDRRASSQP